MQVVLDLPDVNIKKEELKILLAIKLFEEGIVSLEKAAEIVGYSEQTFSKILLKKGISPIKYDDLNLKEEFKSRLQLTDNFPILFENDAWSFVRGEAWMGAARGYSRIIGITLGTGMGSGFLRGIFGIAGRSVRMHLPF